MEKYEVNTLCGISHITLHFCRHAMFMAAIPAVTTGLGLTNSMFLLESVVFNSFFLWQCARFGGVRNCVVKTGPFLRLRLVSIKLCVAGCVNLEHNHYKCYQSVSTLFVVFARDADADGVPQHKLGSRKSRDGCTPRR